MQRLLFGLFLVAMPLSIHAANTPTYCQNYAAKAVQQNKSNLSLSCGFTGLRWNNDQKGQYNWCLTVSKTITDKEDQARSTDLAQCQTNKNTSTSKSALPLPALCKSTTAQPVKSFDQAFRYQTQSVTPVQPNGLIQYDFNQDTQTDYLFLERTNTDQVRLVQCMSMGRSWKRLLSDMEYSAKGDTLFGTDYTFVRKGSGLHITIDYFAHNDGSCITTAQYHYNTASKAFKLVKSKGDCTSAEPDYPIFPVTPPTLKPKN